MDLLAFAQLVWSRFLAMDTFDKGLVIVLVFILLGSPFLIIEAIKAKALGMCFEFRHKLLVAIGYTLFALGRLVERFDPHQNATVFVWFSGVLILGAGIAFMGQAKRERAAYRDGTLKPMHPISSAPTDAWPPAPAGTEG